MSLNLSRFYNKNPWFCLLVMIVSGLLLCEFCELPSDAQLLRGLQNALHIPFFGVLALISFLLLSNTRVSILEPLRARYIAALCLSVVLGAAVEVRQLFTQRDASLLDLLYDTLGAVLFLSVYAFYHRHGVNQWSRRLIKRVMVASLLGLAGAMSPLLLLSGAVVYQALNFPVINRFDSIWEYVYLDEMEAEIRIVAGLPQWKNHMEQGLLELRFQPAHYSGVWIDAPYPDWRGFRSFNFTLYSEHESEFMLFIRIHDYKHNYSYSDRFKQAIKIRPGENTINIPLEAVRLAPKNRSMQMESIALIGIYITDPALAGKTIWIDDIVLQ